MSHYIIKLLLSLRVVQIISHVMRYVGELNSGSSSVWVISSDLLCIASCVAVACILCGTVLISFWLQVGHSSGNTRENFWELRRIRPWCFSVDEYAVSDSCANYRHLLPYIWASVNFNRFYVILMLVLIVCIVWGHCFCASGVVCGQPTYFPVFTWFSGSVILHFEPA